MLPREEKMKSFHLFSTNERGSGSRDGCTSEIQHKKRPFGETTESLLPH